jgi:hypothetical protein
MLSSTRPALAHEEDRHAPPVLLDTPHTDFAFPAEDRAAVGAKGSPADQDATAGITEAEATRKVVNYIRHAIIAREGGKIPPARTIGIRLIVLSYLLAPEDFNAPLAGVARELKCSRTLLSKHGLRFAELIGMSAAWQRIAARKTYSERQRAVHAGTHEPTDATERRKLREARARTKRKSRRVIANVKPRPGLTQKVLPRASCGRSQDARGKASGRKVAINRQ